MATALNCQSATFILIFLSQIFNTAPTSTKEPYSFYTIYYPKDNKNFSNSSKDASTSNSTESSGETDTKHYIPFDPEVLEGEMPPSRKELPFERLPISIPSIPFNETSSKQSTLLKAIFTSTNLNNQEVITESTTHSQMAVSKSNSDKETTSSEDFVHPEEINYLGKEESESTEDVVSSLIDITGDDIIETTFSTNVASEEMTTESSELSSIEQNSSTEITLRTESSIVINGVETLFNITLPVNTTSLFKNSSIINKELKDSNFQETNNSNYILLNKTVMENNLNGSNFSSATEITKVNIKFTISAEDTRMRTKEDNSEETNKNDNTNLGSTSSHESAKNMTVIRLKDYVEKMTTIARQPKAIDRNFSTQANHLIFHKNNLTSSPKSLSSTNSPKITTPSSTTTTPATIILMLNNNLTDTFFSTSTENNEDSLSAPSSITTPSYISETLSIFKAFSDMKNDSHFQETISILTKNINPSLETLPSTSQRNSLPSDSEDELESTIPPVERATIRRRLLRPSIKATSNPQRNHRRTHTQSAIQEFTTASSTISSTPPPKTLNETVAPPVFKIDASLDYPMDMPDTRNFFEDSSSNVSISPKTTNTIIISSIIGGCAMLFFAFLMIFCMCKQKRNNRRTRY